jgi:protein ImuA
MPLDLDLPVSAAVIQLQRPAKRDLQAVEQLRHRIRHLERGNRPPHPVLPFGVLAIDRHLPDGGLSLGALHEVAGGELGALHGAAAALFAAGILARLTGMVLWCLRHPDLFAPALAGAGLHPDRVIYLEAGDERGVLQAVEEGLRHGGLAGVVGETSSLPMTASRRLQLAAEASGALGLILRRWEATSAVNVFGQATAAVSRWRIATLPSSPLPVDGIGRPRWQVELLRCRRAEPCSWDLEACDAQGRLAVPADLAYRPAEATDEGRCTATG